MPRGFGRQVVHIDAPGLSKLARDLRGVQPVLLKELRTGIRKAAEPIKRDAQANARQFSRRIPGAIGITAQFPARGARVTLRTNAKRAPHARPIENDGRQGAFRHPLFGDRDHWVAQAAHPFFFKAVAGRQRQTVNDIEKVADVIIRKAGFR